jgi:glutamyl-tRNA synthetase
MNPGVRVRFAPSPTGYLHIGGARTALFNYLYAKRHKGTFVLRIEDTDKERSSQEATDAILEGMKWLELSWDEGPFFQSKRYDLYKAKLDELLKAGKVYRCYCTAEELEERRKAQIAAKRPPKYDGRCREFIGKTIEKPHTLRFLVPTGVTKVQDVVKGNISFNNREIEDLVLARSDGSPTYNFVVVVDDVEMKISHIIRGDDHLNNTPKQILLYEAMGGTPPIFAHVPLILGEDKQRLSKRHGATSVQAYRELGYLPHSLVNFLARLGWSHGDQEIFSLQELIEKFDLDSVGKSAGVFNAQKLLWLNQHYIKSEPVEVLLTEIDHFISIPKERKGTPEAVKVVDQLRERSKTTKEMADLARFYFHDEITIDPKAKEKFLKPEMAEQFQKLRAMLDGCEPFDEATIKPKFEALIAELGIGMGQLAQPLRVALVGGTVSPGIFEVLAILGKDRSLKRVDAVIASL